MGFKISKGFDWKKVVSLRIINFAESWVQKLE